MIIYTDLVSRVIEDITQKVPGLAHIEPERVAVAAAPRWAGRRRGELAKCVTLHHDREPSFFVWVRPGTRTIIAVSPWYRAQPIAVQMKGVQCRYLIRLTMPRFFVDNPVETIIHELYHIGEKFDGELREARHGRAYDRQVHIFMGQWLARANPRLAEIAQMGHEALERQYGSILALSLPPYHQEVMTLPSPAPCSYERGVKIHYPEYTLAKNYTVRQIPFTDETLPRQITEKDCTLRVFKTGRSESVSPSYARYMRLDRLPFERVSTVGHDRIYSAV